jgi:hypothetical protein
VHTPITVKISINRRVTFLEIVKILNLTLHAAEKKFCKITKSISLSKDLKQAISE